MIDEFVNLCCKYSSEDICRFLSDSSRASRIGWVASDTRTELARVPFEGKDVVICLKARGQTYDFYYGTDENNLQPLYLGADAKLINQPVTGNMVGTCMGMFASANGAKSENWAEFDYFTYEGKD